LGTDVEKQTVADTRSSRTATVAAPPAAPGMELFAVRRSFSATDTVAATEPGTVTWTAEVMVSLVPSPFLDMSASPKTKENQHDHQQTDSRDDATARRGLLGEQYWIPRYMATTGRARRSR
jgi:hypothetical protein